MAENDEPMIQTPADFGHFLLEKELGHGGMGGVYLARDKMLDRRVGIKVMLKSLGADPKFVERFQREAQAAARLNHPNIAQIYSFGQEQGMPYIAMELVPGGSLDKEMEANPGTLDVAYVMRVGQQVADALALAAESGLVHGDVKPENVLFDTDGNAKLVDFGLAAMQGDSDEIWGTPFYISPEKVRRQKIDYRADIYSLGGTLYHVLTGVPPFDGPDPTAVVKARFDGPPKKPSELRPEIPPEVDAIIMRMLELEPSMRYPTYQSLLGDFKRYLAKAGPAKAGKSSGPKLKFKGIKPKVAPSATANTAADGEIADLQPVDDLGELEEEKKSMGLGMMVGLVVGGIILVLLLVAGGLWWYVSSSKNADEQKSAQEILNRQQKARQSIENSVNAIKDEYTKYHELVLQGDKAVKDAVGEVKKALPEELQSAAKGVLDPLPLPVSFTNKLSSAQAPATAAGEKPAATNAVEATAAEKKADDKKDEAKKDDKKPDDKKSKADDKKSKPDDKKGDAKKAKSDEDKDADEEKAQEEAVAKAEGKDVKKDAKEPEQEEKKAEAEDEKKEEVPSEGNASEEKPAENAVPALQLPKAVKKYEKLWEDVCQYRAADIMLHGEVQKLLAKAKEVEKLTEQNEDTANKLATLANELVEGYNRLKGEKWLSDAKRKVGNISTNARKFKEEAVKKINDAVESHKRKLAEKLAAEEKAKAAEAAAAKLKATIEEEQKSAEEEFRNLEESIKRIDWSCTNSLIRAQAKMTTREGKDAMKDQIRKIEVMAGMQRHFIKNAKGVRFTRGKVLLAIVTKVEKDGTLTIQKTKRDKNGRILCDRNSGKPMMDRESRLQWRWIYDLKEEEYLNYMNSLIVDLVLKGQERPETRVAPREWSDHMLGAALTLRQFYGNQKGVDKFVPELVQKAVKGFGPSREWAVKWFPDVKLEDPDE